MNCHPTYLGILGITVCVIPLTAGCQPSSGTIAPTAAAVAPTRVAVYDIDEILNKYLFAVEAQAKEADKNQKFADEVKRREVQRDALRMEFESEFEGSPESDKAYMAYLKQKVEFEGYQVFHRLLIERQKAADLSSTAHAIEAAVRNVAQEKGIHLIIQMRKMKIPPILDESSMPARAFNGGSGTLSIVRNAWDSPRGIRWNSQHTYNVQKQLEWDTAPDIPMAKTNADKIASYLVDQRVVFADPAIDITGDLIKYLNDHYQPVKEGPSTRSAR